MPTTTAPSTTNANIPRRLSLPNVGSDSSFCKRERQQSARRQQHDEHVPPVGDGDRSHRSHEQRLEERQCPARTKTHDSEQACITEQEHGQSKGLPAEGRCPPPDTWRDDADSDHRPDPPRQRMAGGPEQKEDARRDRESGEECLRCSPGPVGDGVDAGTNAFGARRTRRAEPRRGRKAAREELAVLPQSSRRARGVDGDGIPVELVHLEWNARGHGIERGLERPLDISGRRRAHAVDGNDEVPLGLDTHR